MSILSDLKAARDKIRNLERDLRSAGDKIGNLESDLRSAGDKIGNLESDLRTKQERIVNLEAAESRLKGDIESLKGEIGDFKNRVANLGKEIDERRNRVLTLEAIESTLKEKIERTNASLQAKTSELAGALASAVQLKEEFEKESKRIREEGIILLNKLEQTKLALRDYLSDAGTGPTNLSRMRRLAAMTTLWERVELLLSDGGGINDFTKQWLSRCPGFAASLVKTFATRVSTLQDAFNALNDAQKIAARQNTPELIGRELYQKLATLSATPQIENIFDNLNNHYALLKENIMDHVDDFLTKTFIFYVETIRGIEDAIELLKQGRAEDASKALLSGMLKGTKEAMLYDVAFFVDEFIDLVATAVGIIFGRRLTSEEIAFCDQVFHSHITQVERLRIVETTFENMGMVAGTHYIFIGANPMVMKPLFAHELTHVYQDQKGFESPGTLGATKEQIDHLLAGGPSPYSYVLTQSTNWDELGMEQQAAVVGAFQSDLGGSSTLSAADRANHRRVLDQAGLF